MISRDEVLMGRDKQAPLSPELEQNLGRLLRAVNVIRRLYNKPMTVSSGYRPASVNSAVGGAKASFHMRCLAVDFKDADGAIDAWLSQNQDVLEALGLWQEHPDATKGWAHVDLGDRPMRDRPDCLPRQFKP